MPFTVTFAARKRFSDYVDSRKSDDELLAATSSQTIYIRYFRRTTFTDPDEGLGRKSCNLVYIKKTPIPLKSLKDYLQSLQDNSEENSKVHFDNFII
ncbi:hypothetical protein TNCV_4938581 [Trichonephila clavipes]|nr:hypothetical protein TNCV_4938581 [Trichonephila clavipes]